MIGHIERLVLKLLKVDLIGCLLRQIKLSRRQNRLLRAYLALEAVELCLHSGHVYVLIRCQKLYIDKGKVFNRWEIPVAVIAYYLRKALIG